MNPQVNPPSVVILNFFTSVPKPSLKIYAWGWLLEAWLVLTVAKYWLRGINTYRLPGYLTLVSANVLVNSKTAHPPPPRAIPGHLTRVKLRTVGNLTQNEARPVGHLTFVSKRLSAVGNKRISQFFDSAHAPRSRALLSSIPRGFFCCCRYIIKLYRGICLCLKCGAKTGRTRNS